MDLIAGSDTDFLYDLGLLTRYCQPQVIQLYNEDMFNSSPPLHFGWFSYIVTQRHGQEGDFFDYEGREGWGVRILSEINVIWSKKQTKYSSGKPGGWRRGFIHAAGMELELEDTNCCWEHWHCRDDRPTRKEGVAFTIKARLILFDLNQSYNDLHQKNSWFWNQNSSLVKGIFQGLNHL